MIRKYDRSPNSQKYYNKMHINSRQCFDMTLAQMDIGVYQPLHNLIMMQFKKLLQNNLNTSQGIKIKRHYSYDQLQLRAKQSIIKWYNKQFKCQNFKLAHSNEENNGIQMNTYVLLCTSIVTFCSYCIIAFTKEQDNILIMTPVYSSYISIIQSLKRRVITTKLQYHKSSENSQGNFYINFNDIQQKIKNQNVKMILLSHPHNPSGRTWKRQQINLIVDICKKYEAIIVSDQILSDLYLQTSKKESNRYYSLARQFQNYKKIIVLNSISKSFNYSSLQAGYGLVSDYNLFRQLSYVMKNVYGEELDGLGVAGICGCLTEQGRKWLDVIANIIKSNYIKLLNFRRWKAPLLQICQLEAAYILYVDMSSYFTCYQQLSKILSVNNIWVISLGSNYYRSQINTLEVRICIACEQDHFDLFLLAFEKVIIYANQKKKMNLNAKL